MRKMLILFISVLFVLTGCNNNNNNNNTEPKPELQPEPCIHIDIDVNGECDNCNESITIPYDVKKDVSAARNALKKLSNMNIKYNDQCVNLSSVSVKGNMFESPIPSTMSISKVNDTMFLVTPDWEQYRITKNDIVQVVTKENNNWVYSEEMLPNINSSINFDLSQIIIEYNNEKSCFMLNHEQINNMFFTTKDKMNEFVQAMPEMKDLGIETLINNLLVDCYFSLDDTGNICNVIFVGYTNINDCYSDIFQIKVDINKENYNLKFTFNYLITMEANVNVDIFESEKSWDGQVVVVFPQIANMTPMNCIFSCRSTMNNVDSICIPDEVQECINNGFVIDKTPFLMQEKYFGTFDCEKNCHKVGVYDSEYNKYAIFEKYIIDDKNAFMYIGYSELLDNDICLCEIDIDKHTLVLKEHSLKEIVGDKAYFKYKGLFTCNVDCKNIAVWDEEYQCYIVFRQDYFEEHKYKFSSYEKDVICCIAQVDLTTYTLTITNHVE